MNVFSLFIILAMLMPAVILHEVAHGWVANKMGDPTARMMGRLTLNPIKHIDLVGTILLPLGLIFISLMSGTRLFVFGMAKPVPVNPFYLRHPKQDMIWVGLAGPAMNILLAIFLSLFIRGGFSQTAVHFIKIAVMLNLLLAVFNLIPIPPLDGSRLVAGILPNSLAQPYVRLERFGILIVFALLYLGIIEHVVFPIVSFLGNLLGVV